MSDRLCVEQTDLGTNRVHRAGSWDPGLLGALLLGAAHAGGEEGGAATSGPRVRIRLALPEKALLIPA